MISELLGKLDGLQGSGPRWRSICPSHESRHATRSLSIYEPDAGRVLFHCHAGCSVDEIMDALGIDLSDLFPPRTDDGKPPSKVRKPWRISEVVSALRGELFVGAVLLMDIAADNPHSEDDRVRAKEAVERIGRFLDELDNAS